MRKITFSPFLIATITRGDVEQTHPAEQVFFSDSLQAIFFLLFAAMIRRIAHVTVKKKKSTKKNK